MTALWRIRATSTATGLWDVRGLRFLDDHGTELAASSAFCSGSASDPAHGGFRGYDAAGCILGSGMWGGRPDRHGRLFLGAAFDEPVRVRAVRFSQPSERHWSAEVALEYWRDESPEPAWVLRRFVQLGGNGACNEAQVSEPFVGMFHDEAASDGEPPDEKDLTVDPSQPLTMAVHDVCYKSRLQARCADDFVPDPGFYLAENCEGLWVCVSQACGEETLQRACALVRAMYPPEHRRLWGEFVSPAWARDPGPMRLVVLDNRSGEQMGMIPELQDDRTGRNCTCCPWVFTSREDFFGGVAGWHEGRLTVHEMTHGADMVLRQAVDPYIHEAVRDMYRAHREKFCFHEPCGAARKCYAAANRDEFLAECHVILQGLMRADDYDMCGLGTPDALGDACPDVVAFLLNYFVAPIPATVFED